MIAPLCAATSREACCRVHGTSIAITSIAVRSALMRSPHEFHGVFDVAPLSGFFGVALLLASLGILGRLGDSLGAVLLEHLPCDHVNLYLRYHVALLMFHHARNRKDLMHVGTLRADPSAADPTVD